MLGHKEKEFLRLPLIVIGEAECALYGDEADPVLLSLGSVKAFGPAELEAEPCPADNSDSILDS